MLLTCSWPDTCIRAGRRFSHHWTLVWGRGIHHNHYTTPHHRSVYRATIIIITTIVAITFAASKIPTIERSIDQQCWCRLPSTSSAHCLFSQFLGPSTTARLASANVNYCQLFQSRLPIMVLGSVSMFPGFPYKQTPSEPPGDLQDCDSNDEMLLYHDPEPGQARLWPVWWFLMTSTKVQAVKLNIGVTVTANLAIFLFLVQVNNKQKSWGEVWHPILQECLALWLSQLEARPDPDSVAEVFI